MDRLDMEKINQLGQLYVRISGSTWWPLESIDVETGLFRIDVIGMLEAHDWCDAFEFRDESGKVYEPEEFETPDAIRSGEAEGGAE